MKAWINFQSIKAKLVLAFIASMLIISMVSVAFIWFEYEESRLVELRDLLNRIDLTIRDMEIAQQNFIRNESINPEFYEKEHSNHLLRYRALSLALKNELMQIEKQRIVQKYKLKESFEGISTQTDYINQKFDSLFQLIRIRGFKDYGVEGEMRRFIHYIEDSKQPISLTLILTIRRHEKDFIIRKDESYVSKLKTAVSALQADIIDKVQDINAQRELLYWSNAYQAKFLQMVEYDRRIGIESKSGLIADLARSSIALQNDIQSLKHTLTQVADRSSYAMRSTLTVLVIGFFILNIALSFFVFQQLGKPINSLSTAIRNTIQNDFKIRNRIGEIKRNDEIGELARDFDWMFNKVQEQTQKLTDQNIALSKSYENLTILSEIGQKIIANLDIRKIIEITYHYVHQLINSDVFAIGVFQPENHCLYFYGKKGQEEEVIEGSEDIDDEGQLSNWCFKHQKEILINDFYNEYHLYLSHLDPSNSNYEYQSYLYIPLMHENDIFGVMATKSMQKNAFESHHINILENIAVYVSIAFSNARIYRRLSEQTEELRASEEELSQNAEELMAINNSLEMARQEQQKFVSLIEMNQDYIALADFDENIIYMNDSARKALGLYEDERLFDYTFRDFYYQEEGSNQYDLVVEEIRTKGFKKHEAQIKHAQSGEKIDVDAISFVVRDQFSNKPICVATIQRDITELKKKERIIQKANEAIRAQNQQIELAYEEISTLNKIGQEITKHLDVEKIVETVYENLRAVMSVHCFGVGIYDPEHNRLEFPGLIEEGQKLPTYYNDLDDTDRLAVYCFKHERILYLADYHTEYYKYISQIPKPKVGKIASSIIYLPLKVRNNLFGVITVQSFEKNAYSTYDLNILKSLVVYISIALENAHVYTQLESQKDELEDTLNQLQATQNQLIESEKMAALGQIIAGVAHEINTPLGAIRSSVSNISRNLDKTVVNLPEFFRSLKNELLPVFFQLLEKSLHKDINITAREERSYRRTLQRNLSEQDFENPDLLAELLVEIGIYAYHTDYDLVLSDPDSAQILQMIYQLSGLKRSASTIELAIERASKIVFALKSFARTDSSGEMIPSDIREGLETVLTLYHNQIKQGVELIRDYQLTDAIYCFPDELNQVWTNLIHNALQAMHNQGTLYVSLFQNEDELVVSIRDTGQGIPPEIRDKIFRPFFTTKPAGEGSGLGLDIVRRIIEKHKGKIELDSEINIGSTFRVYLPRKINQEKLLKINEQV